MNRFVRTALACAALCSAAGAALAADVAGLARLAGPQRETELAAGARKEGEVSLYSSLVSKDIETLAAAFEKKYGVKVKFWRAGSEKVLQRAVTEARAGRHEVDVIETNGPELEAMSREKILAPIAPANAKDILPAALEANRGHFWTGLRLNIFVQAYNTNLVKKAELPKSYDDLLDPKWKGRLAMEAEDVDWFAAVVSGMGEQKGLEFFRKLVANGLQLRKGHTLLAGLVGSGEIPMALSLYNHNAEKMMRKGAPVEWFQIQPAYARVNGISVAKAAPHPHAALLFYDYMLGPEGQKILEKAEYVPVNLTLGNPYTTREMRFIDPAILIDAPGKWDKLYDDIIVKKAR